MNRWGVLVLVLVASAGCGPLNRDIRYAREQCDYEGVASSCAYLGSRYRLGKGVAKDLDKAAHYLEKACGWKDGWGCLAFADAVKKGHGVKKDPIRAMKIMELACQYGQPFACALASTANPDNPKGRSYLQQACDLDELAGCIGLLDLLTRQGQVDSSLAVRTTAKIHVLALAACENGIDAACRTYADELIAAHYFPRDAEASYRLDELACRKKYKDGCYRLAWKIYYGQGAKRDPARARVLLETACKEGRATACARLARLVYAGEGGKRSITGAVRLWQKSCADKKASEGCYELGLLTWSGRGTKRNVARARALFERACLDSHAASCAYAAAFSWFEQGGERDEDMEREVAATACKQGLKHFCSADHAGAWEAQQRTACVGKSVESCALLAAEAHDQYRRIVAMDIACVLGSQDRCSELAVEVFEGTANHLDDRLFALARHKQACLLNSGHGCMSAGIHSENADGTALSLHMAAEYFRRACDIGMGRACGHLARLHRDGKGVAKNRIRAAELFARARELRRADEVRVKELVR